MKDALITCAENRDFETYARELHAAFKNETVAMTDLIDLILALYRKEIAWNVSDPDEEAYYRFGEACCDCEAFAFHLLMKGILEGRWSCRDGVLGDGERNVSLDEIDDICEQMMYGVGEDEGFSCYWFRFLRDFDPEAEAFRLAPLDSCTGENVFIAAHLVNELHASRISSLEELEKRQLIWPEQHTRKSLTGELERMAGTTYCYFFLEQANTKERGRGDQAYVNLHRVKTVREAVLAASEFDARMGTLFSLPYSAYLLLTGRLEDAPLPEEPEIVPEPDRMEACGGPSVPWPHHPEGETDPEQLRAIRDSVDRRIREMQDKEDPERF